jgi:hypothetical protein
MGDHHLGHEGAQRLGGLSPVLVDVDDRVGERQAAQFGQVDVLGAADLGHAGQHRRRVGAVAGAGYQLRRQAERGEQLGHARHQAGDAHGHGARMPLRHEAPRDSGFTRGRQAPRPPTANQKTTLFRATGFRPGSVPE